jgi:hypothetical protein
VLGNSTTKIHIGKGVSLFPFHILLYNFVGQLSATVHPDIRIKFPPTKVASAEGSFVSSMEKAALAWAIALT